MKHRFTRTYETQQSFSRPLSAKHDQAYKERPARPGTYAEPGNPAAQGSGAGTLILAY